MRIAMRRRPCRAAKKTNLVDVALESQSKQNGDDGPDFNRHSCGSFFMNPILTPRQAETLPEDAPRFDAALPGGGQGVKTSAAWLIDHAGFHKGFKINENAPAGLSTLHTLALTNRGEHQPKISPASPKLCRTASRPRSASDWCPSRSSSA